MQPVMTAQSLVSFHLQKQLSGIKAFARSCFSEVLKGSIETVEKWESRSGLDVQFLIEG